MGKTYEQRKEQVAEIRREMSKSGRDIGPLPKVVDAARRESCRLNFRMFCEVYFPNVFTLDWSTDHLLVIQVIQDAITGGGLFAVAMARASGKTSLCLAASAWALLYGHRSFVVLVGASEDHATKLLKNLIVDFESNDLLAEDFPEVCHPIRKMERITKRAQGQTLNGESTRVVMSSKELVLPTVEGSIASGSRIAVAGITGAIRGLNAKLADGSSIRPDFVLIDDPQTSESAQSPKQVRDRLAIVNGDILGLAGPKKKISAVMPCTVICRGDMADQVLDRKACPEWQGVRTSLLRSLPTNLKAWEEYAAIRAEELRAGNGIKAATDFYVEHQQALDEGADASWPQRFNADEASAIQNAMNLKLRDEHSFFAEYQNAPLSLEQITPLMLSVEQITSKSIGLKRGIVPAYATKLVGMTDVQGSVLYYAVVAVGDDYTGHVVDYGCWPDQARSYFFLREVNPTLADKAKGLSFEGQLRKGLEGLSTKLLNQEWQRADVGTMQIDRLLIDSGYMPGVIKQFIAESGSLKSRLLASKGYGIKADRRPLDEWTVKEGDRRGWNWLLNRIEGHLLYDTNGWKTFLAERLRSSAGEIGNLSIFEGTAAGHKMFAEHLTSEYPTPTEGLGRTVNVWNMKPNRENHLLDCVVGCLVAASEQGRLFTGHQPQTGLKPVRRHRKLKVSF